MPRGAGGAALGTRSAAATSTQNRMCIKVTVTLLTHHHSKAAVPKSTATLLTRHHIVFVQRSAQQRHHLLLGPRVGDGTPPLQRLQQNKS